MVESTDSQSRAWPVYSFLGDILPKQKERNSEEYYRGIIRELKKEIRQLRQQLRQYEKYASEPLSQDEEQATSTEDTYIKVCKNCGKGKLKEIDIVGRIFEQCDICDYRRKVKGP
jgi:hypothetical protein